MSDLVEWLRQQLDDDERIARAAFSGPQDDGVWTRTARPTAGYLTDDGFDDADVERDTCRVEGKGITIYDEGGHDKDQAEHIARHDPARVLAEVDAKRRILAWHDGDPNVFSEFSVGEAFPCLTVRLLALPYADRPGYRDEWKP